MIRPARPEDALEAANLIMIVLKDMDLDIFNRLPEEQVRDLLVQSYMKDEVYRYGFRNALVKEINGSVAGIVFGYPDHLENDIDNAFITVLSENNLSEEFKLFTEPEVFQNEWYIDTLVTSPDFRGQGVASELLIAIADLAKQCDKQVLGLNVDKVNEHAKQIYLRSGFENVGELTIANHTYEHLQKKLDNIT